MKSFSVEAFVLRRRHLGEADRILTLFSRERGKLSVVAKSARKAHSKFGARLDFFTRARFALHAGRSLDVVTAVENVKSIWDQLVNPDTYALASYVAEVVDALCEPDFAIPELYAALCELQDALGWGQHDGDLLMAVADLRILNALGLAPELDACARCGTALGERPLRGGRAMLSPHAGGLVCSACLTQMRAAGETSETRSVFAVSAQEFSAVRRARAQSLTTIARSAANGHSRGEAGAHKATRAFVEYQLGRRSKALTVGRAGSKFERATARRK